MTRTYPEDEARRVEGMTREEVCVRYRDKVLLLARRVHDRLAPDASVALDDLVSCGSLGLLEAFDRFDASRGIQFSTFAEYRIRGSMYDDLRKGDVFTRRRRELAKKITQATRSLRRQLNREPIPQEVAKKLEIPLETYFKQVARVRPISHVSLDSTHDDDEGRPLIERLLVGDTPSPDMPIRAEEIRAALKEAIAGLPDRSRQCVLMYYGKEMTLAEIAEVYGVTVSRISQILSEARRKMRKRLEPLVDASDLNVELDS